MPSMAEMAGFRTQYTRLNSNSDDPEEDLPPQGFDIGARGFEEIEKGNLFCKYFLICCTKYVFRKLILAENCFHVKLLRGIPVY